MSAQLDLYRHSPDRLAETYRQAAQTELMNPHYTLAERQRRHDYYAEIAAEFRRKSAQHRRDSA